MAVQKCTGCEQQGKVHSYQDTKYGKWFRVCNPCKGNTQVRCTICCTTMEPKGK